MKRGNFPCRDRVYTSSPPPGMLGLRPGHPAESAALRLEAAVRSLTAQATAAATAGGVEATEKGPPAARDALRNPPLTLAAALKINLTGGILPRSLLR